MLKILKQRVVDQNSNQILKKRNILKWLNNVLYYLDLRNGAVIKTIILKFDCRSKLLEKQSKQIQKTRNQEMNMRIMENYKLSSTH